MTLKVCDLGSKFKIEHPICLIRKIFQKMNAKFWQKIDMNELENQVPTHVYRVFDGFFQILQVLNENELTAMMFQIGSTMMPAREIEDARTCLFCHLTGDGPADGPARLLNYDVDKWVHLNW